MPEYQIGDVFIFSFNRSKQWVLLDINKKCYKFFDIWSGETWTSHRTAPIHRRGPEFIFRNGKIHYKNNE